MQQGKSLKTKKDLFFGFKFSPKHIKLISQNFTCEYFKIFHFVQVHLQ